MIEFFQLPESNKKCQYVLPQGGLFKFVACPNFMCEIVLYISLYVILGIHHYPWALITCWVVMNQVYILNTYYTYRTLKK